MFIVSDSERETSRKIFVARDPVAIRSGHMGAILENCALDRRFSSEHDIRDFCGFVHVSGPLFKFGRLCRGLRTLTGLRP